MLWRRSRLRPALSLHGSLRSRLPSALGWVRTQPEKNNLSVFGKCSVFRLARHKLFLRGVLGSLALPLLKKSEVTQPNGKLSVSLASSLLGDCPIIQVQLMGKQARHFRRVVGYIHKLHPGLGQGLQAG